MFTEHRKEIEWGGRPLIVETGKIARQADGAVMVTTPQQVATGDVRRGIKMFERVNTRVLGIVENMSGDVFGSGGGEALAQEMGLPFLGRVPLDAAVAQAGDAGAPTVVSASESEAAKALDAVKDAVEKQLAGPV